ncbi:MAG: inorganic pyrophosphatase [Ruminococcaceae bacterium]|nr:inorganic pyrophosphatase [Oscillospiraceae bacterium]
MNNIGRKVRVIIDRPIGSSHPEYPDLIYECNYGYIEGIIADDGEEQDAYVIGILEPIDSFDGVVIAQIIRKNDVETKWVVASEDAKLTEKEIRNAVNFQEKFFEIKVLL